MEGTLSECRAEGRGARTVGQSGFLHRAAEGPHHIQSIRLHCQLVASEGLQRSEQYLLHRAAYMGGGGAVRPGWTLQLIHIKQQSQLTSIFKYKISP